MKLTFSSSYVSPRRHYLFSVLSIRSKKKKRNTALSRKQNNKKKKQPQAVIITLNINQDVCFWFWTSSKPLTIYVCFAAVCKEWCALSKAYNLTTKRWSKQIIMVPMHALDPWGTKAKTVQCLWRKNLRQYSLISYQSLLNPDKRFCGSSHGWLATVDTGPIQKDAVVIQLWNPFRKLAASPISLPSLRLKFEGLSCQLIYLWS